jgi:hypothetical protein
MRRIGIGVGIGSADFDLRTLISTRWSGRGTLTHTSWLSTSYLQSVDNPSLHT